MKSFLNRNIFTKLLNWEYWPFQLVYLPIFIYWLWCSIRSRSFFFFSASNPGMDYGGMLLDPKFNILKKFEPEQIPKTILINKGTSFPVLMSKIGEINLDYPIIAKPDIGERGLRVEKIDTQDELKEYHDRALFDYLVQEYILLPLEVGIFYYRMPEKTTGTVSSIVVKKMLQVKGDGFSTVRELILRYPRAKLQLESLERKNPRILDIKPDHGSIIELETIGNHNRGTTFLNGNELINPQLVKVMDQLAKRIPGFYYGRFDIKCSSMETLNRGENFKILELNGAKSEPAHIYQPGFSLVKAYSSLFYHWRIMYKICKINHKKGEDYPDLKTSYSTYRKYLRYLKVVKSA